MSLEETLPNLEVSVVIPCLNEADTIATCVAKAVSTLKKFNILGEVIVADNGSTDGSQELAEKSGARIIPISQKGYGSALKGGINAARGKYVIMGDADDSYDFCEIPSFVEKLRQGFSLVQGCRLPKGGGTVKPGAMPFLHRWVGNPMLTKLAQIMFHMPIQDVYCGLRGFTKDMYQRLDLKSNGMEFAVEMVVKSSVFNEKIAEIPITLHQDGRVAHPPHLRTFRDGWRTLRFFLLYSPRWLFSYPGIFLMILGVVGYALALPGVKIGRANFDVHTLLVASLAIHLGYQSLFFALVTKTLAVKSKMHPPSQLLDRVYQYVKLETGVVIGVISVLAGLGLIGYVTYHWYSSGFGNLDYPTNLRFVIPGTMLATLGAQTILSSFFLSAIGLKAQD